MLITLIVVVTFLLWTLIYSAWTYDRLNNPPYIPETEQEKLVRDIKLRIADIQWKFRRELGKL